MIWSYLHRRKIRSDHVQNICVRQHSIVEPRSIDQGDSSIKKRVETLSVSLDEDRTDMAVLLGMVGNIVPQEAVETLPFDILLGKLDALGRELRAPSSDVEAIVEAARLCASE